MKSHPFVQTLFLAVLIVAATSCGTTPSQGSTESRNNEVRVPIDIMPSLDQWGILLGNGESTRDFTNFQHKDYFYTANDGRDWVVYKTPDGGITSPNSHNTRTELGQKARWTASEGGNLTGTLKVMHVSTSGDARVASSYSVVVGQIHSDLVFLPLSNRQPTPTLPKSFLPLIGITTFRRGVLQNAPIIRNQT